MLKKQVITLFSTFKSLRNDTSAVVACYTLAPVDRAQSPITKIRGSYILRKSYVNGNKTGTRETIAELNLDFGCIDTIDHRTS